MLENTKMEKRYVIKSEQNQYLCDVEVTDPFNGRKRPMFSGILGLAANFQSEREAESYLGKTIEKYKMVGVFRIEKLYFGYEKRAIVAKSEA